MTDFMKLPYSGVTSSYLHKHSPEAPNTPDTPAGLRKVWFLDAQWSTCPREVEAQVKALWRVMELSNDVCIIKASVNELLEMEGQEVKELVDHEWKSVPLKLDYVIQYIREHGIPDDELVIIHWW